MPQWRGRRQNSSPVRRTLLISLVGPSEGYPRASMGVNEAAVLIDSALSTMLRGTYIPFQVHACHSTSDYTRLATKQVVRCPNSEVLEPHSSFSASPCPTFWNAYSHPSSTEQPSSRPCPIASILDPKKTFSVSVPVVVWILEVNWS